MKSEFCGYGSYLPRNRLSNADLESLVETSDEWIFKRTGIKNRHIAADQQTTSDLATQALQEALADADLCSKDLDGIIVATSTPDIVFPSTAAKVHRNVNAGHAFALDLNAACSGFLYALTVADSMIRSGQSECLAVIGAETMSRITDWEDRRTCVLFGDGAGTIILRKNTDGKQGIISSLIEADCEEHDILLVPGGTSKGNYDAKIVMNGREVFKNAVDKMAGSIMQLLEKHNLSIADIDLIVPHQANQRIFDAIAKKVGVENEKIVSTIADHANTSAATIPLAIDHSIKSSLMKEGQLIVITAMGAGLTWGSMLVQL